MSNALAKLIDYTKNGVTTKALLFMCPGCELAGAGSGLHILPVNTAEVSPAWTFNDNLEAPTLSPSILTRTNIRNVEMICHSFLKDGVFQYLDDCTHQFKGQYVEMVELPSGWSELF